MTAQPARRRVKAATLALAGIAMLATTACATASAATSGKSAESAGQRSSSVPIVVNCGGQTLRRPNIYLLECADGYAFVGGLTWSTWGSSSALASGTSHFNDCTPNCLSGRGHTFPALVVLWRARARPGHAGVRYFSEMTIIYTGNRSYTAGGKKTQVPQTQTILLSPYPGAGPLRRPAEFVFLLVLRDLHAAESLVEPPRPRVVLLDRNVEGKACRRRLRLEALDDRGTDPAALNVGQ
jgi:hypothetical protein